MRKAFARKGQDYDRKDAFYWGQRSEDEIFSGDSALIPDQIQTGCVQGSFKAPVIL